MKNFPKSNANACFGLTSMVDLHSIAKKNLVSKQKLYRQQSKGWRCKQVFVNIFLPEIQVYAKNVYRHIITC